MLPVFKLNVLQLCFRTTYVASTIGIALLFPYFNDVLGVLGALNFWPLAIYFPVEILCWVHGGANNFQIELRNVFAARVRIKSHGYHSEEVVNGGKSWVNDGSHERVDQSSLFKQLGKEEDNADKVVRNDDLDVQGEVAENQWVDMEKTGLMNDDSCNSLATSIVEETARDLEIQVAAIDPSGSKTSMQSKSVQSKVVGNCRVVENLKPFGLMRSLSDNGIARPTINLEVVLSQAQYEGLCDGSELGLGRQNVENSSPLALVSLLNPEVEAQSNVLFEAHDNPGFDQQILIRSDKGKKVMDGYNMSVSKHLPVKNRDMGKRIMVMWLLLFHIGSNYFCVGFAIAARLLLLLSFAAVVVLLGGVYSFERGIEVVPNSMLCSIWRLRNECGLNGKHHNLEEMGETVKLCS
ncbi:putative amino acid permease 7 [Camellia lanceoleosa]|uniref:Amino acid permease 7 n=1 Tax=Camellia lanceoleosa TaxID=1840588 RepID=A0ACC0H1L4_9ERIC|nr:putative amino acid permease 7 [Camellia lanceoleosa]